MNEEEYSECAGCGSKRTTCVDCMFLLCGVAGCALYQDAMFLFARAHNRCEGCHVLRCETKECRCAFPFYWVTPTIAIGNKEADPSTFDVVVDLNYPQNGCGIGEVREEPYRLSVGVPLGDDDVARSCLAKTVTMVNSFLAARGAGGGNLRILFVSTRGQTRSVLVCMYYLFRVVYRCAPTKVLVLVREQATRPVVISSALGEMFGMET